ncbi:hypothetical protein [Brevifollis gellanilyticus]|uniref:Peptidase S8/S53 domain-containing protein n=1 Tax=Brevifollis gellanilyticus TaxID=748831 RepID=A0A512M4N2_9BACT|nr:hypothetical protein [Brevifollis gellanilyticus]GEP41695.1 hypothetical protein BGE01nite_09860 [Brevifollis gellanilyticus]
MKTTFLTSLILTVLSTAQADWRDEAGLPQLQAELGAALPTGAGIPLMMSEASTVLADPPTVPAVYLPQATTGTVAFAGTGNLAGKTITPHSGASGTSDHASGVANLFCGTQSMSQGVTNLHAWWADDFAGQVYFSNPIPAFTGSIQNHSWVGGDEDENVNQEFIRRFDFMVNRDAVVALTPLNNGPSMAKFLANAYHGITAGRMDGGHPQTHSNLDTNGRMKPDIVVNASYTSTASPCVGSVAALLLDAIRPGFPDADDPRVVKSIILSGASKSSLLGWKRVNTSRPYDEVLGAGQLNVLNAYHILAAGRQAASNSVSRGLRGWDRGTSSASSPHHYFFTLLPNQWGSTVSATLTWHRSITSSYTVSTLANLNLHLRHASGFTVGAVVDESISSIDNVEHLFLRNLPPGEYVLEVSASSNSITYGLSWEVQTGTGPQLSVTRDGSQATISLSQLDPLKTYTIEHSSNLTTWQPLTTLRTADTTPATTATQQDTVSTGPKFYRLAWTP